MIETGRRRRRFINKTSTSIESFQSSDNILDESAFSFCNDTLEPSGGGVPRESLSSHNSASFDSCDTTEHDNPIRSSISSTLDGDGNKYNNTSTSTSLVACDSTTKAPASASSDSSYISSSVVKQASSTCFLSSAPLLSPFGTSSSFGSGRKRTTYGSQNNHNSNATKSNGHGKEISGDNLEEEKVRGASKDVYAIQDAGSYRLGFEHCSYLCSTIASVEPTTELDTMFTPLKRSHTSITHSNTPLSRTSYTTPTSHSSSSGLKRYHTTDCSFTNRMDPTTPQTPQKKIRHTSITANAACELANMISISKQRAALLVLSSHKMKQTEEDDCSSALTAILDALASAPLYCSHNTNNIDRDVFSKTKSTESSSNILDFSYTEIDVNQSSIKTPSPAPPPLSATAAPYGDSMKKTQILRTRSSRTKSGQKQQDYQNQRQSQHNTSNSTFNHSNAPGNTNLTSKSNLAQNHENRAALALSIVAHYLSMEAESSSFLRYSILKHKKALLGISRLVQFDSLIHIDELDSLLYEVSNNKCNINEENTLMNNITMVATNDDCIDHDINHINGLSNKKYCDPTAYGRKKRKKKRGVMKFSEIQTISENVLDFDLSGNNKNDQANDGEKENINGVSCEGNNTKRLSSPLSFTNESVSSSSSDIIPQRPKGKKRKLENPSLQKLFDALSRIHDSDINNNGKDETITGNDRIEVNMANKNLDSSTTKSAGFLALNALKRILSIKDNIDDHSPGADMIVKKQDEHNPFYSNIVLRESESLPVLAKGMISILKSTSHCIELLEQHKNTLKTYMLWNCIHHLHLRIEILVSILDGACCLTSENRRIMVVDTGLVESLILLVSTILKFEENQDINGSASEQNQSKTLRYKSVIDILRFCLQTLTSLTHENCHAGHLLLLRQKKSLNEHGSTINMQKTGFNVIFDVLRTAVNKRNHNTTPSDEKSSIYDIIIFCLNTMTNITETPELLSSVQKDIFSSTVLVEDAFNFENHFENHASLSQESSDTIIAEMPALKWLSGWLVKETESYRKMIIKGEFGLKKDEKIETKNEIAQKSHEERDLMKHEEESLVMTGNGFVFLACLMKESRKNLFNNSNVEVDNVSPLVSQIRERIFSLMPNDNNSKIKGSMFMIKTLKAFLNFYHYSIGDLSVAVVEPVVKLIEYLHKL